MRPSILVLLCAGCAAARPHLTRGPRTITLESGARVEVEAGTLAVPENRAHLTGRTSTIPYYRLRSTAKHPATPIFVLAGGPGSSGLERFEGSGFPEIEFYRTIADVVVFDQRGGGRTQPALRCDGPDEPPLPLDQPVLLSDVMARFHRQSVTCRDRLAAMGTDLTGLTTPENAADVDALRAALGYPRMSLIGTSYGSHLALALMRRYPETIDRVVLSGVEGPDHTWDDPGARLAALARIAAAAEASPAFRDRIPPGGLLAALREVIERLAAQPARVTFRADGHERQVVIDATIVRLGSSALAGRRGRAWAWPSLILALHRGDYDELAPHAAELRSLPLRANAPMHYMMDCASGISPERAARITADAATEIVGDVNFEYRAVCDAWPAPDLGPGFRGPVVSSIPTLLVNGTWDTKTPIENAREVAASLPNGQLLEVVDGSHNALQELFKSWAPMRPLLARFLRGEAVRFPARVELPPVSFETSPGR